MPWPNARKLARRFTLPRSRLEKLLDDMKRISSWNGWRCPRIRVTDAMGTTLVTPQYVCGSGELQEVD